MSEYFFCAIKHSNQFFIKKIKKMNMKQPIKGVMEKEREGVKAL